MALITKQHALAIAAKLGAIRHAKKNRPHDLFLVFHQTRVAARFGIRRGSKKDAGHDHLSRDLHLSPHDTVRLAECALSREDWIAMLRAKGLI